MVKKKKFGTYFKGGYLSPPPTGTWRNELRCVGGGGGSIDRFPETYTWAPPTPKWKDDDDDDDDDDGDDDNDDDNDNDNDGDDDDDDDDDVCHPLWMMEEWTQFRYIVIYAWTTLRSPCTFMNKHIH